MPNELTDARTAAMRAGAMFDDLNTRIIELEEGIRRSNLELEARRVKIEGLEQLRDELFLRMRELQNDRDLAVNERDEMRIIFYSFKAQLDALMIPLEAPPAKRKRANGKHKPVEDTAETETITTIQGTEENDLGALPSN